LTEKARAGADRLARSDWARQCIPRIAAALLMRGSLTGTEIHELV